MIFNALLLSAVLGFAAVASLPVGPGPEYPDVPQPYKFGYNVKDKDSEQYREEEGDGKHLVKGSYGFTDARGIKRQVDYVADLGGFRAQVRTNEPGTANENPASVIMLSDAPYGGDVVPNGGLYGASVAGNAGPGNGRVRNGAGSPGNGATEDSGIDYGMVEGLGYGGNV